MAGRGRGRGQGQGPRGRGGPRGGPRGTPRGSHISDRGSVAGRPGAVTPSTSTTSAFTGAVSSAIQTVGVRRTGFGSSGTAVQVHTNHFAVRIPTETYYHYDAMTPSELSLPRTLTMEIIKHLQEVDAPQVFTPRAVYDGRKNMFASRELPFTEGTHSFDVLLPTRRKPYKVRITRVATINPELLARFIEGRQSHSEEVLTAITALNVVVRMQPNLTHPFNVRSFFTNQERADIGNGLELWRGFFQSIRPAIGKMLINIDISTAVMYKPGPLINLCLDFLGRPGGDPRMLSPSSGLPDRERLRLSKFINGVHVNTTNANGQQRTKLVIRGMTQQGADALVFTPREGPSKTVAQYFQEVQNRPLRYPKLLCVVIGRGAHIPLEMCEVTPGQFYRKEVPSDKVKDVLNFSTKKPADRLNSIRNGLGVLAYGQSEYVRQFGLDVNATAGPMTVNARILPAPTLKYGGEGRGATLVPRDGVWNMVDRKFVDPKLIERWCVVIYERSQRFRQEQANHVVNGLIQALEAVGMRVVERDPCVVYREPQGRVEDQLKAAGAEVVRKHGPGKGPNLLVVVLPENATDLYRAVKHFGDITMGVATQCMKSSKCSRANAQYFANIGLKINAKLGGINVTLDTRSASALTDPSTPTIVMGADVQHPAAHTEGRPSFAAVVASVDSLNAKYIADCRVQQSRQEIIAELKEMCKDIINMCITYRKIVEKKAQPNPKRIIFYRDGVSEGQFRQVLDQELEMLREACRELKINPAITFIVVGKRHHVRLFPRNPANPAEADRSGNCKAGTVVDSDITHPIENDFYLQSHAGLLGTSRPSHYSVLYDDNNFSADALHNLSYALCHVYARSTRSVSIPAPVYYADIVCARGRIHYPPDSALDFESQTQTSAAATGTDQLDPYRQGFKQLHPNTKRVMFFT